MKANAIIFQSLDPVWDRWGIDLPNKTVGWVKSLRTAKAIAKRAGFNRPIIQRRFKP